MKFNFDNIREKLKPNVKRITKKLIIQFIIPPSIILIILAILVCIVVSAIIAVFDTINVFGDDFSSSKGTNRK